MMRKISLFVGDVKGTACFREIRIEEKAQKGDGQRDDTADNVQPLPVFEIIAAVETLVSTGLKVATKHLSQASRGAKQSHAFAALVLGVHEPTRQDEESRKMASLERNQFSWTGLSGSSQM